MASMGKKAAAAAEFAKHNMELEASRARHMATLIESARKLTSDIRASQSDSDCDELVEIMKAKR
jgi:hypothetical protein